MWFGEDPCEEEFKLAGRKNVSTPGKPDGPKAQFKVEWIFRFAVWRQ
jgi:hypothetical protein